MEKYILAIDQGTTSTRAIIFDSHQNPIKVCQKEIKVFFPKPSWVEQDANEIWLSTLAVISGVFENSSIKPEQIDAIGITNQRETTVIWDKTTGLPVYHAIVWQSRQTSEIVDRFKAKGVEPTIKEKTGLILDPYFSATKIRWILENVETTKNNDNLLFGTIDTWLLWKLTGGKVHATDVTNASRTLLFNIHTLDWDDELLELFKIPKCMLPKVMPSSGIFGYVSPSILPGNLPIAGIAGDQQAALFGQCCFNKGDIKNTYGTGCFALMNTGNNIVSSRNGLLTTVAWKIKDTVNYALEGSVFIGGAAVQWLRDELRIIKDAPESEKYACTVNSTDGVYVVPAFTGLGTPYWDDNCRGAIFGLTRGTNKEILIRATLESIAYQSMDVIRTMEAEAGVKIKTLSVDGGATANNYTMQFQSDVLQSDIVIPKTEQTTALGVSYLAGLAVGYYKDLDEIKNLNEYRKTFKPVMDQNEAIDLYDGWKLAVKAARTFKKCK